MKISTELGGFLGHVTTLSDSEAKDALSKKSPELQEEYKNYLLQKAGFDLTPKQEEPEIFKSGEKTDNNELTQQEDADKKAQEEADAEAKRIEDEKAEADKKAQESLSIKTQEELIAEAVKRISEQQTQDTIEARKKIAEAKVKDFFGDDLESFLSTGQGKMFVSALEHDVNNGSDPVETVEQLLATVGEATSSLQTRQSVERQKQYKDLSFNERLKLEIDEQMKINMGQ